MGGRQLIRWEWTPWATVVSFAGVAGFGFVTGHPTVGWVYMGVTVVSLAAWRQRAAARGSPWANVDLFSRRSRPVGPNTQDAWVRVYGLNAGTGVRIAVWASLIFLGAFFAARKTTPPQERVATSPNLLPASAHLPAGIAGRVFAPPDLGVKVTIPATWKMATPALGFQYVMTGSRQAFSGAFLGMGRVNGAITRPSLAQVAFARRNFLHGLGATVTSAVTGAIDGHPACALQYTLRYAGEAFSNTEFDIVVPGPLLVSLSPTQTIYDTSVTTYNTVVIVLGTPEPSPSATLLGWIASTIHVVN